MKFSPSDKHQLNKTNETKDCPVCGYDMLYLGSGKWICQSCGREEYK